MKKLVFGILATFISSAAFGQIEGKWKTIDDETKQAKSIVQIYKTNNGQYHGKIVQLLMKPENENCVKCKDDRKNKPLIGLEIIRGLSKKGDAFTGGTITNPKDGKSYKTELVREGDVLKVKAIVLGITVKTQTWHKVR